MDQFHVSLLIPCRNEDKFISNCLDSLLQNDYPKDKTEIIVIDGLSNDSTVNIVEKYITHNSIIKLLSNPKKVFPAAVNMGINESKGELVFIIGAHAIYPVDYISKCVYYSQKYNADNVGGVLNTIPMDNNLSGKLVSFVLSNSFGVGNSTFRTGSSDIKEVDTVFGGCYNKEVFAKFGMLNEKFISTSDYEFNKRINRGGGKIFLIPSIVVNYYTRSTFKKFIKNNLRNGYWAIYPLRFLDYVPVSLRHFIPLIFLSGLITCIFLSFLSSIFLYILLGTLAVYFTASVWASLKYLKQNAFNIVLLPFLFFILHLSYGVGSFYAVIKLLLSKQFYQMHFSK